MLRSRWTEQIFLNDGDKVVATIEGIGTLNHAARAERSAAASSTPR